jgi:FkbM family methyltransferase
VREGKTPLILDCGGNIGLASRYFAEVFVGARVVCIEPDAANMRRARANNPEGRVRFRQAAVGAEPGRGGIANPAADNNAYRIERGGAADVEIVSINGLLEAEADAVPFIVKIDIEGFEAELFARNTEWVARFPLLIIELHDWMLPGSASSRSFLTEIARHDRDFEHHGQNIFSIRNGDGSADRG